jgi:hypothetical protein
MTPTGADPQPTAAIDLVCPTCHGSGHVPNRWRVLTRRPGRAGTQVTVNGTGSFSFDEADQLVHTRRAEGDLAWMEPVNDGYPRHPADAAPNGGE